jgi:hypothetical protein
MASERVVPALVAGIHALLFMSDKKDADGRDKPGHDDAMKRKRPRRSGAVATVRFAQIARYIFTPFSAKYFSAPGWNGIGVFSLLWISSEMAFASSWTATRSAFLSNIVFTIA